MTRLPGLAGAVVALVVLFDWLFYGHPIGWTVGAYTLVAWLLIVLRFRHGLTGRPALLVAGFTLSLTAAMVIHPGALEKFERARETLQADVQSNLAEWRGWTVRRWQLREPVAASAHLTPVAQARR